MQSSLRWPLNISEKSCRRIEMLMWIDLQINRSRVKIMSPMKRRCLGTYPSRLARIGRALSRIHPYGYNIDWSWVKYLTFSNPLCNELISTQSSNAWNSMRAHWLSPKIHETSTIWQRLTTYFTDDFLDLQNVKSKQFQTIDFLKTSNGKR